MYKNDVYSASLSGGWLASRPSVVTLLLNYSMNFVVVIAMMVTLSITDFALSSPLTGEGFHSQQEARAVCLCSCTVPLCLCLIWHNFAAIQSEDSFQTAMLV